MTLFPYDDRVCIVAELGRNVCSVIEASTGYVSYYEFSVSFLIIKFCETVAANQYHIVVPTDDGLRLLGG